MNDEMDPNRSLEHRLDDVLQQQRALIERLQRGQAYFQGLARSVWRVQEDERRRLALELHDGVGHNLTALLHLVGQAEAALADRPDEARDRLARARAVAEGALRETRALSRLLRPQILDDLGLEAALRWLARSFHDDHGLAVSLDVDDPFPALEGDLATLVFRVVQESLSNIIKHAGARSAEIGLTQRAFLLRVSVRDDGKGCDPAQALGASSAGQSSGLGGMQDRVRLFGGTLRIESAPAAGCTVLVQFPLPGAPGAPA